MTIQTFISNLSAVPSTADIYNPYSNPVKAKNLLLYLSFMRQHNPIHIFVGEAPGYRGCALSGIPFTSEYQLTPTECINLLPFQQSGYEIVTKGKPHKEASATVIWDAIRSKHSIPLLWNIFPFHPHNPDNRNSNRTPTTSEVSNYSHFTKDMLSLFPSVTQVHALGRTAETQLRKMGITASYIRHPSNGGAVKCRDGIATIIS